MHREGQTEPIQGDLFPESAEAKHGESIEQVVEVDRQRPSVVIMVDGYELTYVLWKGNITLSSIKGATSEKDIQEQYLESARRRATGILRSIEEERKKHKGAPDKKAEFEP